MILPLPFFFLSMEDALQKNFRWILRSGIICGSNFIYSMLQEISAREVHILTISFQMQIYSSRKMHRFVKNLQILWEGSSYSSCESPMSEYTILNATVCIFSCPGRVLIASSVNVDFCFSIHSLNSTNSLFIALGTIFKLLSNALYVVSQKRFVVDWGRWQDFYLQPL